MSSSREFLSSLELIGIKLGLEQIAALLTGLGAPQRVYPSIIVAGTNGKGSVTAMIERGLRASGRRTGRYTSPHLVDLEERVAIDGVPIDAETLDRAADRVRDASGRLAQPPSFFEATTALALDVFREAAIDIAVLEVGMGGRLDATNAVDAMAAAITLVDFDHQAYLGTTLEAIAREKAGVIKAGALVVLAENPPVVDRVVAEVCASQGAPLVRSSAGVSMAVAMDEGRAVVNLTTPRGSYDHVRLALRGRHQVSNALTAVRLLEELSALGHVEVPSAAIRTAVEDVTWPGRLEMLRDGDQEILIDGAHNPAGARALAAFLEATYHRRVPLVIGVMRDKQIDEILEALAPVASHFVFVAPDSPRAATPADLRARAQAVAPGVSSEPAASPMEAIRAAGRAGGPVVVAGSLYLAGEVRAKLS